MNKYPEWSVETNAYGSTIVDEDGLIVARVPYQNDGWPHAATAADIVRAVSSFNLITEALRIALAAFKDLNDTNGESEEYAWEEKKMRDALLVAGENVE